MAQVQVITTTNKQEVKLELIAKGYGISPEEVIQLNTDAEIKVFDSLMDCFIWLRVTDEKRHWYNLIKEMSEITADDLIFFKNVGEKLASENKCVLPLRDGRAVFIFGQEVKLKPRLIPVKLIELISYTLTNDTDYRNVTLTAEELETLQDAAYAELDCGEYSEREICNEINRYLRKIGFNYDLSCGYAKEEN